jgi:hypothetical protein
MGLLLLVFLTAADTPPPSIRPVPPAGVAVPDADRRALEEGLGSLAQQIERLRKDRQAASGLADVEIFYQAVRTALDYQELFDPADIGKARKLLTVGAARARQLAGGQRPWLSTPGPTPLGYRSSLDGSIQPYGVYIPQPGAPRPLRLDAWFHGRGEKLSEVNFLDGAQVHAGTVAPFVRPDALMILPYGRYCNGSKLAGEVDFFEALADLKKRFPVDEDRIVIRGFSLGGASAWHLGAHFAARWAAVAPGAGFAESPVFLRTFETDPFHPTWWEQKLFALYDAPVYAENFRNVGLVAYSGEIDKQKQAADLMAAALDKVGIPLFHVIGPKTAHSYHPEAIATINEAVDALARRGRDPAPRRVSLATATLKYDRQAWVVVDGLEHHWERATVEAELGEGEIVARTRNVTALGFEMPTARCPFPLGRPVAVRIDGQRLAGPAPRSDRSLSVHFHKAGGRWQPGPLPPAPLRKRHDLQGPIDDAFMSAFMMVTPSGRPLDKTVADWAQGEQMHALQEWRRQLRGEPRVRRDIDVTAEDIAAYNLVLWGDPSSNSVLARIAPQLPIKWTAEGIAAGKRHFTPAQHALVAIYPNPLDPRHYVVLNSGVTFREYDYLNNARQIPRLPDWAVVDVTTAADAHWPGRIVDADFFGESWELRPPHTDRH